MVLTVILLLSLREGHKNILEGYAICNFFNEYEIAVKARKASKIF